MNRIHRVLWNALKGRYVVTNERSGTAQCRGGRTAAVVLAAASALAAGTACAAVENGVLTADKDTVVFLEELDDRGLVPQLALDPEDFTWETTEAPVLTGVAENIKNIYLTHGHDVAFVGTDLDIGAAVYLWNVDASATDITIGSADAAKTTGNFASIYVNGWDMTRGSNLSNSHLEVVNSDVRIEKLRVGGAMSWADVDRPGRVPEMHVAKDSTVTVGSMVFDGGYTVNEGVLTLETYETQNSPDPVTGEKHFDRNLSFLRNAESGTLTLGEGEAMLVFYNDGIATATGDLSLTGGDVTDTGWAGLTTVQSENTGTLNVTGTLTLHELQGWGSGSNDIPGLIGVGNIGRLYNSGDLTASNVVVNGQLRNQSGGEIEVTNDFTVELLDRKDDVTVPELLKSDFTTEGDSLTKVGGTFALKSGTVSNAGRIEATHVQIEGGDFANQEGGVLSVQNRFEWTTTGDTVNKGTVDANGSYMTLHAENGSFHNEGTFDNAGGMDLYGTFSSTGTFHSGTIRMQDAGSVEILGGDFDADALFVTSTGSKVSIAEGVEAEIGTFQVGNASQATLLGTLRTEQTAVFLDSSLSDGDGTGHLYVDGTLNVESTVDVSHVEAGYYEGHASGRGTYDRLTIGGGVMLGGDLTARDFTVTGNFDVGTTTGLTAASNVAASGEAVVKNGAVLTVGGGDPTSGLTVENDAADALLTVEDGEIIVAENGALRADSLALKKDGGLQVTANGAYAIVDDFSAEAGSEVNLVAGTLTLHNVSSAEGTSFSIQGAADLYVDGDGLKNAELHFYDKNLEASGDYASMIAANDVHLEAGSVLHTDELTNDSTLTLHTGSVLNADAIDFDSTATGGLTLNGGRLVTSLDSVFSDVKADGYIEGTNVETGEIERIPTSGIQSVGAVKDELTGEHGIRYESGIFEFTDDGWTVNAVNDVAGALETAFDSTFTEGDTVVFSGDQDSESGPFTVEEANDLRSGLVLSNTILVETTDATGVVFGDSAETQEGPLVTTNVTGFQAVSGVDSVTVRDEHKLHLVGFADDDGSRALLTDAADGGSVTVENGTLVLGLDGSRTGGSLNKVSLTTGNLEVSQNGTFSLTTLGMAGNATTTVDEGAKLSVGTLEDNADATLVVDGTLDVEKLTDGESSATISVGKNGSLALTDTVQPSAFHGSVTNKGQISTQSLTSFDRLTNEEGGTVTSSAALSGGTVTNAGRIETLNGMADFTSLSNSGAVMTKDDLTVAGSLRNSGTIVAGTDEGSQKTLSVGSDSAYATLVNEAEGTLEAAAMDLYLTGTENRNDGTIAAVAMDISLDGGASFTNAKNIRITDAEGGVMVTGNADGAKFVHSGEISAAKVGFSNVEAEITGTVKDADKISVLSGTSLTVGETGSVETTDLAVSGSGTALVNDGTLTAAGTVELADAATLTNNGKMTADSVKLASGTTIRQAENGVLSTDNLTVVGNSFSLGTGTWIVGEGGLRFTDEAGEEVAGSIEVDGREYVTADATVSGIAYDVTSRLTFGEREGLADTLTGAAELLANANGVLTVDKGVTVAADGSVTVGEARSRATNAFTANADSVTIFTGNAFADGAAITAAEDNLGATISAGAKAVLTDVQHSGSYTLLDKFDLSANLDEEGNWIGGWTGEDASYVTVENGSDLNWKVNVAYDKDTGSLVADAEAADVRTVYDFSIADLANAALATDASKGADVRFLQAVINNDALSVGQTETIVNSVAQIASSLGTAANFLNDATRLTDTVEARTSVLTGRESGLWVRAEGGSYEMDGLKLDTGSKAGYDTDTYGFTFGADTFVRPDLRIGAAFSYLKGDADAAGDVLSGSNDYDTFGLQAYAAYDWNDSVRFSGEIGWFHTSNELSQSISFADVRKAEADADADAFTFGIRGEHRFDVNGFTVVPHVGLRGLYVKNDDFTTKIDGASAFRNAQDGTFTMQLPVGVAVEKAFDLASGWTVRPNFDVTVTPQFGDTDFDTTVTGIGTGVSQTLNAEMAGDVTGRLALGVTMEKGPVDLSAHYGFTAGDAGRQDHAFSLGLSYRF